MMFVAVAVTTALVYALWVAWVPLLPTNLYTPLLDLGKITGYTWSSAPRLPRIVLVLFGLYAVGLRVVRHRQRARQDPLAVCRGAVFCAELLWAYPATAADVFGYIASGPAAGAAPRQSAGRGAQRLPARHHPRRICVYPTSPRSTGPHGYCSAARSRA